MNFFILTIGCFLFPAIETVSQDIPATTVPPEILSAYHGLDALPMEIRLVCNNQGAGEDGLPVVFSTQLDNTSIKPEYFIVENAAGERIIPVCASLQPAVETLELRTVLLVGAFGSPSAHPAAVEVVGEVLDSAGTSLKGLRTESITRLDSGPRVILAEYFPPDTVGIERDECPKQTAQIIQLTWTGGVTGPNASPLGAPQRRGVTVELNNGEHIQPVALGDDDPDNHILLCLDTEIPALSVQIQEGLFHDPGDDANPTTSIHVTRY